MDLIDRFMAKVHKSESGCWNWTAYKDKRGYGKFIVNNKPELAHRVVWWIFKGPIPDGLEMNHLCENPGCVNPDHLQAVTHKQNMHYGKNRIALFAKQTHCYRGHEFSPENTWIRPLPKGGFGRFCKECSRINGQLRRNAKREAKAKEQTKTVRENEKEADLEALKRAQEMASRPKVADMGEWL